jgi:hypothetical protein
MFNNFANSIFPRLLNLAIIALPYTGLRMWGVFDGPVGVAASLGAFGLLLAGGLFGLFFGFFGYYDRITREWVIGTKVESFQALGWSLLVQTAVGVGWWFGAKKTYWVGTLGGAASPTLSWRRNAYQPPGVFALTVLKIYLMAAILLFVLCGAAVFTVESAAGVFSTNMADMSRLVLTAGLLIPVGITLLGLWGCWSLLKSSFAAGLGLVAWLKSYTEEGASFRDVYRPDHDLANDIAERPASLPLESPEHSAVENAVGADAYAFSIPGVDVQPDNADGQSDSWPVIIDTVPAEITLPPSPTMWSVVVTDGRSSHTYTRGSAEAAQRLADSLSPGWSFVIMPPGDAQQGLETV